MYSYHQKSYTHKGILDPHRYAKQVDLRCYEPSPVLAPFVELYFVARWRRPGQAEYEATDILTSPVTNIFFTAQGAFCSGITGGIRRFCIGESGVYAGVKCRPGGFHAFWPQTLATLTNKTLPAQAVFPQVTAAFTSNLLAQTDDQQVVRDLETLLQASHPQADPKIERIGRIIAAIEAEGQNYTVSSLAAKLHMSERSLQQLFHEYIGVGAKWAIMRSRLLQTIQYALLPEKPNWTNIALELNYSTQSHFTNDFKRLLGLSPSEYAKLVA
jgi:AraC-like DNA-binding protein